MSAVTVLGGPERRRRWSASEKTRIVGESLAPGAVISEVARRHDVHPSLLHHWRRQACRGAADDSAVKFLPVSVGERRPPAGTGAIEIELEGGVRVRVDAAVDEAVLARVLRALRR
jgi:transposase